MSRSLLYLRRGLLGIAVLGSLGFGATQAFANAIWVPIGGYCERFDPRATAICSDLCDSRGYYLGGVCNWRTNSCECAT